MQSCEPITEGVYRIRGTRSNMYLFVGEGVVLVDTGMPGDGPIVLSAVRELGYAPDDVTSILVTHAHLDHIGSLAALKAATGALVVASRREQEHTEGRRMLCSMAREGAGGKLFKGILYFMELFFMKYVPVQLDRAWQQGDVVRIAGFRVLETPGHSPGSLSFFHEQTRLVCTGDALSGAPRLRLPPRAGCSDYARALDSAAALAGLGAAGYLFGHGDPLQGDDAGAQVKKLLGARLQP